MHMVFRIHIDNTSAEQVFHLIANIDDYEQWLPNSNSFYGIRHVSDDPVKVGTTYTDGQGTLTMHGRVTKHIMPKEIGFHQKADFRMLRVLPAGMDINITYVMVQEHGGTTVLRNYDVAFTGMLRVLRPLVISRIREENNRILQVMKQVLEKNY